jgi:hypothetical protein
MFVAALEGSFSIDFSEISAELPKRKLDNAEPLKREPFKTRNGEPTMKASFAPFF